MIGFNDYLAALKSSVRSDSLTKFHVTPFGLSRTYILPSNMAKCPGAALPSQLSSADLFLRDEVIQKHLEKSIVNICELIFICR